MKKCLKCKGEMLEKVAFYTEFGSELKVGKDQKTFQFKNYGKIVADVCLDCGYIELFLDNPEKLKNAVKIKGNDSSTKK